MNSFDSKFHDMALRRPVAIVGPTASGKTRRAVAVAKMIGGEIVSADSRQVYRDMSLGTGKDIEEYDGVPYHLIDIADAGEKYNLHCFLADYRAVEDDMRRREVPMVICGGSGMYVENLLAGVRLPEVPEDKALREELEGKTLEELTAILSAMKRLHNVTDVDTAKRAIRAIEIERYYLEHPEAAMLADRSKAIPMDALIIGVDIDRDSRRRRITERLKSRLDAGMLNEVQSLLDKGIDPENLIYYGLEYKYLTLHLIGRLSYDEMFSQLETAIHQFSKRQMTWFRGMERRGFHIHWLRYDLPDADFLTAVATLLTNPKNILKV